jgi:hypothetical protein
MDQLVPRWGSRTRPARQDNTQGKHIWLLDNGQPRAVGISTGASDGRLTQILPGTSTDGRELAAGMAVITDTVGKPQ